MYHTIEFTAALTLDLIRSRKKRLERLQIEQGTRVRAELKPYVAETDCGPIEVADLFFEDGTASRRVPYYCFSFVE